MSYQCPCCGESVNELHFSCAAGAKGGRKTGKTKSRDPKKMTDAALKRWRAK